MASEEQVKHIWTVGSYPDIGRDFLPMAGHLVDATDVGPGDRVLDVACGTGNVAITAARRGADATGLDITPAMLEDARENAAIAGVEDVDWREGNATALPYADDTFDVTLSCVGHVFATPPGEAAAELPRVTRPGGTVAFTSWTPMSVVPAMGAVVQEYLPETPDRDPPVLWGDPDVVRERLGEAVGDVAFETAVLEQPELSPEHVWEFVREKSGLFIVALENVADHDMPALREDVLDAIGAYFDDSRNVMRMEYRLTTATVR